MEGLELIRRGTLAVYAAGRVATFGSRPIVAFTRPRRCGRGCAEQRLAPAKHAGTDEQGKEHHDKPLRGRLYAGRHIDGIYASERLDG